jgi:hypothetical protein
MLLHKNDNITIASNEAYKNVKKILSVTTEIQGITSTTDLIQEFRYSFDYLNYSDWLELTDDVLNNISIPEFSEMYLEFRYTVNGEESDIEITNVNIQFEYYDEQPIESSKVDLKCTSESEFVTCSSNFNPYDIGSTFNMNNAIAGVINDMWGMCVKYYKSNPDQNSRDVVLKEYSLYDVSEATTIKIMVPDNAIPTNEIRYDLLGMGYDLFEIHIVKSEFQKAFGSNSKPQKDDFILFSNILNNRLYQVESAYLEKSFLNEGTFYRVNLSKYEERSNRSMSDNLRDEIDSITDTVYDSLEVELNDDIERVTKPQQLQTTTGQGVNDNIRSYIDRNIQIIEENIDNNYTTISKHHYQLSSGLGLNNVIKYRNIIKSRSEIALTFWIKPAFVNVYPTYPINSITSDGSIIKIDLTTDSNIQVGQKIKLSNNSTYKEVYEVLEVLNNGSSLKVNARFIKDILDINGSITLSQTELANLINIGDDINISISLSYTYVNINGHEFKFTPSFNNDTWYGIILNISEKFDQVSMFTYTIVNGNTSPGAKFKSNVLHRNYIKTETYPINLTGKDREVSINSCNINLTNIRVFENSIEEETHSNILNQYIVHDSEYVILTDNATPQFRAPRLPI